VADYSNFPVQGNIYVGSEIMNVTQTPTRGVFTVNARGQLGSVPQPHTINEVVSDAAAIFSVRPTGAAGRPLLIYRIDTTPPSVPGQPVAQVPPGQPAGPTYQLNWNQSTDPESDVMAYELQERTGTSPTWRTIGFQAAKHVGGILNNVYQVGNPRYPGEKPRPAGAYFTYRVRAWNFAGLPSAYSAESTPVATTPTTDVIRSVSNYPNPVDLRKAGAKTTIVYELAANSEVTLTLYDLLGYTVREWTFSPGSNGAQQGPNAVDWDGSNGMGNKVSKGGYIARIEVKSPSGTSVVMRKIGVIH
jgi:hypothetical protein